MSSVAKLFSLPLPVANLAGNTHSESWRWLVPLTRSLVASRAGLETCAVSSRTRAPLNPNLSSFPSQDRGFGFGKVWTKILFFSPKSWATGSPPRSVLLPWAGDRSRAGSSCLAHRELNRKLAAELRCRPSPLGHRRDESRAEESTVRAFPEVWRKISAAARHALEGAVPSSLPL